MDAFSTPLGLENPEEIMEAFQDTGNEILVRLRQQVSSPHESKVLRSWGIVKAAEMIGVSAPTLRKQETKDGPLGEPQRDANDRRIYTLERINEIRRILKTEYIRPEGSCAMIMPIFNFKGGSAKTTTTAHLALKCAMDGLKTLIIDFDPQGSLTFVSTGIVPDLEIDHEDTIYKALREDPNDIHRVIRKTHVDRLDIIPGNLALQDLELALPNPNANFEEDLGSPLFRLKNALKLVKDNYDVVLIDCGPNLGTLTMNAILAATGLLIPIPPNMFDYASFIMLTGTLRNLFALMQSAGKHLRYDLFRILLTKHSNSNEAKHVENMIRSQFGGYVLNNYMCTTVEIEKATNDIGTVYEVDKPRGSREAYIRALHHMEDVNNELISYFKQVWDKQAAITSSKALESEAVYG